MSAPELHLDAPRRIDTTLARLDAAVATLDQGEQARLAGTTTWGVLRMVAVLRGMEMAEATVPGCRGATTMADAYDQVTVAGENAVDALLRTFRTVYARPHDAMPEVRA